MSKPGLAAYLGLSVLLLSGCSSGGPSKSSVDLKDALESMGKARTASEAGKFDEAFAALKDAHQKASSGAGQAGVDSPEKAGFKVLESELAARTREIEALRVIAIAEQKKREEAARLAEEAKKMQPGLSAEIFSIEGAVEDYPQIPADRKASFTRIDKQINIESTEDPLTGTNLNTNLYVRWNGVIRIPKDGKYTFYTESDDGSRLLIDGGQVVDNGGSHGMDEKTGDITLTAGDHPIRIELFQGSGPYGCKVSWEYEGHTKELIPETAFFHRNGPGPVLKAADDGKEKKEF